MTIDDTPLRARRSGWSVAIIGLCEAVEIEVVRCTGWPGSGSSSTGLSGGCRSSMNTRPDPRLRADRGHDGL